MLTGIKFYFRERFRERYRQSRKFLCLRFTKKIAIMNKPATIKDIARMLKISTSTVSRALRDASDVGKETKNAVKALAEELNYQPNKFALSLQQKQTHTIGVIVPNLDYVLATMVKGIDEVALEAGYTVMVCQSNESFGREIVNTRRLLDSLVDGFIISVSSETKVFDHFKKIQDKNMPVVVFDRLIADMKVPGVRLDNKDGGLQATEHLLEQGYKRIAILAGPKNLGISNERLDGYLAALKKNKIKVDQDLIIHCDFNQDYAYLATKELLSMKKRPDAIFTISDRMAIGAMLAIKEKGLKMPEDIGLVGFNNEPITSLVSPSISSVDQPAFELGKIAAKLFIETMHNNEDMSNVEEILKPKLHIRESSLRNVTRTGRTK
jgi:LacI family transcriptional regulator